MVSVSSTGNVFSELSQMELTNDGSTLYGLEPDASQLTTMMSMSSNGLHRPYMQTPIRMQAPPAPMPFTAMKPGLRALPDASQRKPQLPSHYNRPLLPQREG